MLYKPVYLKGRAMAQAQIPMRPPSAPVTPLVDGPDVPHVPPAAPLPPHTDADAGNPEDDDEHRHLPVLIHTRTCKTVHPREATRDVLAGRVAYYLVEDDGVTKFPPRHVFCALGLPKTLRDKYGEYPCVGAHQRFLEKKETRRKSYKRRYISPDLVAKGLYGVSD